MLVEEVARVAAILSKFKRFRITSYAGDSVVWARTSKEALEWAEHWQLDVVEIRQVPSDFFGRFDRLVLEE